MRGVCTCSLWARPGRRSGDAMEGLPGRGQVCTRQPSQLYADILPAIYLNACHPSPPPPPTISSPLVWRQPQSPRPMPSCWQLGCINPSAPSVGREHLFPAPSAIYVTQLPHMVSRLVDTSTTFSPLHPCPAPASLQPEDLDAWDCSGQVLHAQQLLQLACSVTVMAQYHVGGFLRQVVASANATCSKHQSTVLMALDKHCQEGQ